MNKTARLVIGCLSLATTSSIAFAQTSPRGLKPTPMTIYVCTNEQGHNRYTDRGCLHGPRLTLSTPNIVSTGAARQVKELNSPTVSDKTKRKTRQQRNELQQDKMACMDAKRGLDDLRERRRRGYRLRDSAMLNRREADLHRLRRQHC